MDQVKISSYLLGLQKQMQDSKMKLSLVVSAVH